MSLNPDLVRRRIVSAASLIGFSIVLLGVLQVATANASTIEISNAWVRATPPNALNSAVYMVLKNSGKGEEMLLAASSPAAEQIGFHTVIFRDGMVAMTPVESIPIPAGGTTELKPGGNHMMMSGLKISLKKGSEVKVTLVFKHAREITVSVPIKMTGGLH